MLDFKLIKNPETGVKYLETALRGKALLTIPQLNKDTAFTEEERQTLDLLGKLPMRVETLAEQVERCYEQYQGYETLLQKNIYLNELHNRNQVLFYKLVSEHLAEMIPVVYTPVVGSAVKAFSHAFRSTRGLYIAYPNRDHIRQMLKNRSNVEIDLLLVTDGESILGIGDQGMNGMPIPIAKLMLYTLFAGIDPLRTLPIQLDVGTNNEALLHDPLYLGWRHPRISGEQYDAFIEQFIDAVKTECPHAFLHCEDFGRTNASRVLEAYKDRLCIFNDDIQGTGVVTLAAILAAVAATKMELSEHRIVIFGAGTAGVGIADEIFHAMVRDGMDPNDARKRLWLMGRHGLLCSDTENLRPEQRPYARLPSEVENWRREENGIIALLEVVKQVKPTVLIGCSSTPNAFNKAIIEQMAANTERPIILPLSNPTELCEALPSDILAWSRGKALIATGSPFDDVIFEGKHFSIAQCNNALVYPGIGLGVIAARAKKLTPNMLWAACQALCHAAPIRTSCDEPLLPHLRDAQKTALNIADAVARCAIQEGVAELSFPIDDLAEHMQQLFWAPHYLAYRRL